MAKIFGCPWPETDHPACQARASGHRVLIEGFSLIEILLVIAVIAVLAASAAPSFAAFARESRLATSSNDLLGTLYFARSEAVKRNRRVSICTTVSPSECASHVGWHQGWMVFEDANDDGERDEAESILLLLEPRDRSLVITGSAPVRDYISYVPTGETRAVTGALQMGVLTLCDQGAARKVIISATGRPRISEKLAC